MTEKLYYSDSHLFDFNARVVSCRPDGDRFKLELDRTAFFPEGGGQQPDTGLIGNTRVHRADEREGVVEHTVDAYMEPGTEVYCHVDREQRLRRMQNHSGEHIVSGLVHKLYGFDNVGFHMGADCMTIDFSGELSAEQASEVERLANEAVRENIPIKAYFPSPEELAAISYRSKLELTENVRLVEIPGIDVCACCAPHVGYSGEIGLIKILTREKHRGGVRLGVICGMDAYELVCRMQENVTAVSNILSAKREEIAAAVERIAHEKETMSLELAAMSRELVKAKAALYPRTEGNICVFENELNELALRELINLLVPKCDGMAAGFSGSDEEGYRYIISSRSINMRERAKDINAAIKGRGGGSAEMIQGRASETGEKILKYFKYQ